MTPLMQGLHTVFGFNEFRDGQQQTIEQLLAGHSSLAVFPTGSGKSLCYQFTATQLPHLTLVISPLIALMHDQLAFLASKGIPAACLDSSQSKEDSQAVMAGVQSGAIKVLMISVERFKNERFRRFIKHIPISMLVIDEAHCISEWGHNFRPDYLKLPAYQQELAIPLVLLLTATATRRVQRDMAQKFSIHPEHIVQTGFYRSNLDIDLIPIPSSIQHDKKPNNDKLNALKSVLDDTQGSSIVYVTQQKTAEHIAHDLQASGYSATAYHAGLDSDIRSTIQADFMTSRTRIIVATIAFGMGIDKADIRLVVHFDLPKSIENYSQEIGRAGRDNQPSRCVLLANLEGLSVLENFVYGDTPEPHNIEQLLRSITEQKTEPTKETDEWETQLYGLSQQTNIRSLPLKTLLVQLELLGAITPKYSYYADVRLKWEGDRSAFASQIPAQWQAAYQALLKGIQYKKIWGTPDFDRLFNEAGLSRGDVLQILEFAADQQVLTLESKGLTEVYQVHSEHFHHQTLANSLHQYVEEKQNTEIARIATMMRFFQLDRCLNNNLARYFGDQHSPEQCGHCSVCRKKVLVFSPQTAIEDEIEWQEHLLGYVREFTQHIATKSPSTLVTSVLISRFLTGLTQPIFTKIKARQLSGFGVYENRSYVAVHEAVTQLLAPR